MPSGTRGTRSRGAVAMSSGELPHVGAGNSGPLQEQCALLTAPAPGYPAVQKQTKQVNKQNGGESLSHMHEPLSY